jgi:hypothetical protein
MARAGFYAVQNSEIRFGRDGRWYADGEPIANARIADLFSRHLQRAPDGSYVLRIGDEEAAVIVDDTPYVVTAVEPDGAGALFVRVNDGSREALDPHTLHVGANDVVYCRVKRGSERARFLRAAYYQLSAYIAAAGERFVLRLPAGDYPIGRQ